MKRSEIIELSNQLTERKAEAVINLNTLFSFVVQDICKRQRFWWRRVAVNWQLTPNQTTYDLADETLFPTLEQIAVEEITKFTLILSPSPLQVAELTPIFDPETYIEMIQANQSIQPARYTMQQNSSSVLLIDPPDLAYNAFLVGWGMPNPSSDSADDSVPMIPSYGHNAIVSGLNAKIFKFAYGTKNEKTVDAQNEYELAIQDLMNKKQFDPNYRLQLSLQESAVRST